MEPTQALLVRLVTDAAGLAVRFRDVEGLRHHLAARKPLVTGASAALLAIGIACGAGSFIFLAETSSWLALPALVLAPFVTLGSLFVGFYVFFSWVEGRALARALGRRVGPRPGPLGIWLRKKARIDMGAPPPVPWIAAAVLVFLPLAMLAMVAPTAGLVLILIAVATPLLYARFDPKR